MLNALISIFIVVLITSCIPTTTCMTSPCKTDPDLDDLIKDLNNSEDDEIRVNTPSGVIAVKGSAEEENSRDLERMAAMKEQQILTIRAERISAQFGLSSERGIELARMYSFWNKKSAMRTLSPAEQNQLSLSILGTDLTHLNMALKQAAHGDSHLFDQVANKAALLNGTSPEHMREILNNSFVE